MKIGIITASLHMETKDALRKAKEIGAHGVQLWVANSDLDPRNLSKSGREDLLAFMDSIGLERSALCGDIGGFAKPETVDQNIARTKEFFDLCVDLKTPILTTHIGHVPEDENAKEYAPLVEAVREVAQYAAERGCCFATETGPETGAVLAKFLRKVDSPGAKVNFDPANLTMRGFDCHKAVYDLKDFIVHTHAKDGTRPPHTPGVFPETPLGEGNVDFPKYLGELRDIGYTGYLTIERECGDDPVGDVIKAVTFLKGFEGVEA